jgi:hypothetical protein
MTVYKITDPTQLEKLVTKRRNHAIIPTQDGNGDLIIGPEVLADPIYADLDLRSLVEEIEYVPLPTDEKERDAKFEEFATAKKLITADLGIGEVLYGDYRIQIKSNREGDESTKEEIVRVIRTMDLPMMALTAIKNLFS